MNENQENTANAPVMSTQQRVPSSSSQPLSSASAPTPEYGQMASQYPGWDSYVFGKPEIQTQENQRNNESNMLARQNLRQSSYSSDSQQKLNPDEEIIQDLKKYTSIDPDNPKANPYYGKWDFFAISSFVISFFSLPFISIPLALFSLRRTRILHMRGKGLAIAALVLSILDCIATFVLWYYGINPVDAAQQLTDMLNGVTSNGTGVAGSTNGTGGGATVSA